MSAPLRLLQVGVGGWGSSWLDRVVASDDWDLAGIADTDRAALAAARDRHGIDPAACFTDVGDAARAVGADAALVAVPVGAHLPVSAALLEHGLHLLVEKPLADTMTHAVELVAAAGAADRKLMVSQNYRYRRGLHALSLLVGQGWLGRVHHGSVEVHKQLHFVLPDTPHGFAAYRFARDAAVHHVDQIRAGLATEITRVYARADNPPYSWFAEPPMVSALLELADGGVVHFYGSWIARARQTTFDGDWLVEFDHGQVAWSGGSLRVRPVEPWLTIQLDGFVERADGWMEAELDTSAAEDRTRVLQVFADSLRTGAVPPTDGADNLRTLAVAFALEESARTGRPVDVAEVAAAGAAAAATTRSG